MKNMKQTKIKTRSLVTALLVMAGSQTFAQHAYSVCSDQVAINGNQYQYTIGEMTLITTESASSFVITQGFLQPNMAAQSNAEEGNSTSADNMMAIRYKVYPNPSDKLLFVESLQPQACNIQYRLLDATGKLLQSQQTDGPSGINKISFDLESYAAGNYYLTIHVRNADGAINQESFKIQKK